MANIFDYIRNVRKKYENWAVREDMAKALEWLLAAVTGLKHNSGASNLIEYPSGSVTTAGITYETTDEGIHIYGTATEALTIALDWGKANMTPGKYYIASLGKFGTGAVYFQVAYFMDAGQETSATIGQTEGVLSFFCPSQYVSSKNSIYIPAGSTVDVYLNPRLRLANSEDHTQPEVYTVEEISEKIHSGSIGGGAGFKVVTQASQMVDTDMIYVYNGSESGYSAGYWYYHNGSTWTRGAQFYLGRDGVDGTSPTATVTAITGGARLTVTDANGTTTADVTNTSEDLQARADIETEADRASQAEEALGTRVSALENEGSAYEWTTVINNTTWGPYFTLKVCPGLGLFSVDLSGVWSSVPATSGAWITVGQDDAFKYAAGYWSDSYKTHFQFSKNYKAELYISPDGTVYFGQTAEMSTNNNVKVSKGAGCRAKLVLPLPSMFSPIEEDPGRSVKAMRKVVLPE